MSYRSEIAQMLKRMPPHWKEMYNSGRRKLAAKGGPKLPVVPTPEQAMQLLGITAGGNLSDDVAKGKNKVPTAVRDDAMHGIRLSYDNNYGAWDFIGLARAIQLAISPGVPDSTHRRMRNYFTRHAKDKRSARFGDEQSPSRGYMAWLNWGGDAGERWVRLKANPERPKYIRSNPAYVVSNPAYPAYGHFDVYEPFHRRSD